MNVRQTINLNIDYLLSHRYIELNFSENITYSYICSLIRFDHGRFLRSLIIATTLTCDGHLEDKFFQLSAKLS